MTSVGARARGVCSDFFDLAEGGRRDAARRFRYLRRRPRCGGGGGPFAIDVSLELGVAGGVLQVPALLIALRLRRPLDVGLFTVLCTALVVLAWSLSPAGGEGWKVATNRLLAVGALWAVAALGIVYLRGWDVFRDPLASMPMGMLLIDRGGRIVFANERVQHIFGYGADELHGLEIAHLVPPRFREAHRAHEERFWHEGRPRVMGGRVPWSVSTPTAGSLPWRSASPRSAAGGGRWSSRRCSACRSGWRRTTPSRSSTPGSSRGCSARPTTCWGSSSTAAGSPWSARTGGWCWRTRRPGGCSGWTSGATAPRGCRSPCCVTGLPSRGSIATAAPRGSTRRSPRSPGTARPPSRWRSARPGRASSPTAPPASWGGSSSSTTRRPSSSSPANGWRRAGSAWRPPPAPRRRWTPSRRGGPSTWS